MMDMTSIITGIAIGLSVKVLETPAKLIADKMAIATSKSASVLGKATRMRWRKLARLAVLIWVSSELSFIVSSSDPLSRSDALAMALFSAVAVWLVFTILFGHHSDCDLDKRQ